MKKICKKIVVVCLLLVGILNNSFNTYASSHKETTEPGNLYALSAVLMDGTSRKLQSQGISMPCPQFSWMEHQEECYMGKMQRSQELWQVPQKL